MESPIVKSVTPGTNADSSINPYAMLESKCELIECSSIMVVGAHNRCSFEVTLKVNNKRFIAKGPTVLSAQKRASLAALREMHNGSNNITNTASPKTLDFGDANEETEVLVHDLSDSDIVESVSVTPLQEHISNIAIDHKPLDPQKISTNPKTADHSKNVENAEASTNVGYLNLEETCIMDTDDDFQNSNAGSCEDDLRLLPIQQQLENIEDVTLGDKFPSNTTNELLSRNAIILDSLPSIKVVSHFDEYNIPIKSSCGNFQGKEELSIAESQTETILNQSSIVDELVTEPNSALDAEATEKIYVKTTEKIRDNKGNELPAHVLDSNEVIKCTLPNLNLDTSEAKDDVHNSVMVTEISKPVNKTVENEKNKLTILEADSRAGNPYDTCTIGLSSDAELNQLCIEVQSTDATYPNEASKSQDVLKDDVESNRGIIEGITENTDDNNKGEDNISCNLNTAGSPMAVREGHLLVAGIHKSPGDELFTARSSSILNAENNSEVEQETDYSTKLKTEILKEDRNVQINYEPVTESNENEEKSEKAPNPSVFSGATENLEDHTKSEGACAPPVTNPLLEEKIDTNLMSLKEANHNIIYDNSNQNTTCNLEINEEYDKPKGNFGSNLSNIDAVIPKNPDRQTISKLETDKESDITLGLKENPIPLTEEVILKETPLSNSKICMRSAFIKQEPNVLTNNDLSIHLLTTTDENINRFAEMDKDSDLYQTNESIILPISDLDNSVDLPITINKVSLPNPFAKKLNGGKKASEGCAKNVKDKETNKCVLNPFAKKIQTLSSANIATSNSNNAVKINNLQHNIPVVDLVEKGGTKCSRAIKPATKLLTPKRKKCQETLTNPVSKKSKLDIIAHTKEVSSNVIQLEEGTDANYDNINSIANDSSVELITTQLEMNDDNTVGTNYKREATINHCLSILLNDDEQQNGDLEVDSISAKTVPVAIKLNAGKDGNNFKNVRCVKTTTIGKNQPRSFNRNPINLNDDVLEDPITPKTKPPTAQLKKVKTPSKKFIPKLKGKSPNMKPRFHPYKQRYLQELTTKRKSGRYINEIGNPLQRLNAICPGIKYRLESEMGPSHAHFFILSATMNGRNFYGHGKSKHLARLDAAKQILDTLHSGPTANIEPINSIQNEQLTAGGKRKNNQPQAEPKAFPMANQVENNNINVPFPHHALDSHSNSLKSFEQYVSPLPPRQKRRYANQYSNNNDDNGLLQSLQMQIQCGAQGFNFDIASSTRKVYNNHQFDVFERPPIPQYNIFRQFTPNFSENFYNGSPQFNLPEMLYIPNSMPNNPQYSHHHQHHYNNAGDYDSQWGNRREGANRRSKNKRNHNNSANDESTLMSNNPRQIHISVDNTVAQPPRPRSQCMNPEPPTHLIPNEMQKNLHLPQRDSDIMEQLILERFKQLTQSRPEVGNYKVLAGIVMTRHLNFQNAKVIAVATGTKCINGGNISSDGSVINDSHAEIIVRRCLMKFLYTQLKYHCRSNSAQESIFLRNPTDFKYAFTLKPQVQFHLYISTAPCGDARVFNSSDDCNNQLILNEYNHGQLRTKVEGGMGTTRIGNQYLRQSWDGIQIGDPLHTMSCSDKIARWNVLGIQGGLLATLTEPIYLSSIVLGSMFNTRHLYRAVCGRLEQSLNFLPSPFRLNRPLLGQTSRTLMRRSTDITPCIGVNWTFGDNDIEIISLPAGREITNKISFLSKKIFFQKFISLVQNIPNLDITQMPNIYAEVKLIAADYQMAKQVLFDAFQNAELGCWVKKPVEQNEFSVSY